MIATRFAVAFVLLCWVGGVCASPRADLESPSQPTRDEAAKLLRATFVPPARTNWDAFVASLQVGTPRTNVLARLRAIRAVAVGNVMEDTAHGYRDESFWLDDVWIVECRFDTRKDKLVSKKLKGDQGARSVWVEPPPHFTGTWRTYYANGQLHQERHYQDGQMHGAFTLFTPDGKKCSVVNYVQGTPEGESITYYPSGHVQSRGFRKPGERFGSFTNYNEDGTIRSRLPEDSAKR